jgi:hypothetical protein
VSSFHLLPRLARNLIRLGVSHPELDRWKGVYRRAFTANEIQLRELASLRQRLADGGVRALAVGGAAVIARACADSGLRPMDGLAILVPPALASRAFDVLHAEGWRGPRFSPAVVATRRGDRFERPDGRKLDLRWYLLGENSHSGADDSVWKAATSDVPAAEDLLLLTCVDGLQHAPEPGMPWPADVWALCESGAIDWKRLEAEAVTRRVVLPLRTALRWMKWLGLDAPIPKDALARLEALPVTPFEERELAAKLGRWNAPARLRIAWSHHLRRATAAGLGPVSTVAGFVPYALGRLLRRPAAPSKIGS